MNHLGELQYIVATTDMGEMASYSASSSARPGMVGHSSHSSVHRLPLSCSDWPKTSRLAVFSPNYSIILPRHQTAGFLNPTTTYLHVQSASPVDTSPLSRLHPRPSLR
ncbi:succinate dehydrogenase flavo subunit [Cordyceps militaris]|uniref:Succinate dehydrogenase flavo subunit n=1 Tax=Cordyceps militaris TaxID=73501 RepID=A0A2H4SDH6_CORMI|nr:succinate dehydrogenase flavo subunit [Cordyceps militaris]